MEYPRPLHPPFQYFRTPMEANYGGTDAMRDYCPFNVPTADGSGLCTVTGTTNFISWPSTKCILSLRGPQHRRCIAADVPSS
jgi:hypothetical protein